MFKRYPAKVLFILTVYKKLFYLVNENNSVCRQNVMLH